LNGNFLLTSITVIPPSVFIQELGTGIYFASNITVRPVFSLTDLLESESKILFSPDIIVIPQ
jgi:hypothetical protein